MTLADQTNGQADPDAFDVRGSLRTVARAARSHKWLVLITCLLTVGLMTIYIVVWPPVYSASTLIVVERDVDHQRDSFYAGWNVFRKEDARSEIELISSAPVIAEVVEREGIGFDDVYHPFLTHATYLWEQSSIGQAYRSLKNELFPEESGGDAPSPEEVQVARTILAMSAGVSIEPIGTSNVARVTVRGPSRRVASYANTLVEVYLARRTEGYRAEAEKSYETLNEQALEAERAVGEIERRRLAFAEENGLAFDFQKETLEITKLTDLEEAIAASRLTIAGLEASLSEVESQLELEAPVTTTLTAFALNAVRESMKLRRLDLQTELMRARTHYLEDSPEILEIKNNLAALDGMLAGSSEMVESGTTKGLNAIREELVSRRNKLRSDLVGARAGFAVQEQTAAALRERLAAVPSKRTALQVIDRELAMAKEKYGEFVTLRAQAAASLAAAKAAAPSMRVAEYANPPHKPVWPRTKFLILLSLFFGLALGIGAALIRTYTSGRIRREQVAHGRGALPLYGTIHVAARGRPFSVVLPEATRSTDAANDPRVG